LKHLDSLQSPVKYQWYFITTRKNNPKIHMEAKNKTKQNWIAKAILSKKNTAEGITIPHLKTFSRAILNTARYRHKN
jgi:hypothetical protein